MSKWVVTAERGRTNVWVLGQAELGCVSQCRRLDQVADEMREAIAYQSGEPECEVEVEVKVIGLPPEFEIARQAMAEAMRRLDEDKAMIALANRRAARVAAEAGLTVRDIGGLMGVSYQRAAQLVAA